ncbi:High affinity cAMP-specific and IBMX-insensitive 3',5'-cyclic phosphodiesterase 9A [Mortierella sp. GBA43]|nr:High affinity cAMP-specific and IBMX-insensitive 3',5'-cyclic phosphodiesterase 9A [Mortierella sp. GBA43]
MLKFTSDRFDTVGLDFCVWDYSIPEIYGIIVGMFNKLGLTECLNISESELLDFIIDVDRGYLEIFYHSFYHAADVTAVLYHMLLEMNASQYLSKPDMAALLLAGLCHDIGHPGLNNLYQANAKTELAQQFGDASVLEKYSCSLAMDLVTKHRLFRNVAESPAATLPEGNRATEESMREAMIKAIMATDMSFHYDMLNNLNALTEFTSTPTSSPSPSGRCCGHSSSGSGSESETETDMDSLPPSPTCQHNHSRRRFECPVVARHHRRQSSDSSISSACSEGSAPSSPTSATASAASETSFADLNGRRPTAPRSPSDLTPELRQSLSNCLLHAADISNPVKPWGLCKRWSDLVVQEFFLQGDIEKAQHLPVSPNMDRDQHNQPQISLGFSDFVVQPYFESFVEFLPEAAPFLATLSSNREQWVLQKEAMEAEKKALAAKTVTTSTTTTTTVAATAAADAETVMVKEATTITTTATAAAAAAAAVDKDQDVVATRSPKVTIKEHFKSLDDDDIVSAIVKPRVDLSALHVSPGEALRRIGAPSIPVYLIPDTRFSVAPGVVVLHDTRSQRPTHHHHRRMRHSSNNAEMIGTQHGGGGTGGSSNLHALRKVKRSLSGRTLATSLRDLHVAQAYTPPHTHTGASTSHGHATADANGSTKQTVHQEVLVVNKDNPSGNVVNVIPLHRNHHHHHHHHQQQHHRDADNPRLAKGYESSSEDERLLAPQPPPPIPVRVLTRPSLLKGEFAGLPTPDASPKTELSPTVMAEMMGRAVDPPRPGMGKGVVGSGLAARHRHGSLQLETDYSNIRQEYENGYVLFVDPKDANSDLLVNEANIPPDLYLLSNDPEMVIEPPPRSPSEPPLSSSSFKTAFGYGYDEVPDNSMSVSNATVLLSPTARSVQEDSMVEKMQPVATTTTTTTSVLDSQEDLDGPSLGCVVGRSPLDANDKTKTMITTPASGSALQDGTITIAAASAGQAPTTL